MNKVISINLGGNAYQVEEAGYELLKSYLESALSKLEDNPDKDEIRLDLERAIGEKAARFLSAHKNVLTAVEAQTIIDEMGPVSDSKTAAEEPRGEKKPDAPKRLYRIRKGALISGVCTGIAAYFDIDVTLVRIIFVILGIITHGAMILAYFIMVMIVPKADSPETLARATGTPFTAQEWIDRARSEYNEIAARHDWHKWEREDVKRAKEEHKRAREEHKRRREEWRREHWHETWGPVWGLLHGIIGLIWTGMWIFLVWWAYHRFGPVHQFIDWLVVLGHRFIGWLQAKF